MSEWVEPEHEKYPAELYHAWRMRNRRHDTPDSQADFAVHARRLFRAHVNGEHGYDLLVAKLKAETVIRGVS